MSEACSVNECINETATHGFCRAHYRRWQRHGDPLGGGIPKGETGRYARDVIMAYEGDECFTWPYGTDGSGRGSIQINGKHIRASRYVCLLAHGEPPEEGMHAAHSCGNGHLGCVTKKHLRWATAAENAADMDRHGRLLRGEKSTQAKLSELDVQMIRILVPNGFSLREVASRFGVSRGLISKISLRKSWSWLPDRGMKPTSTLSPHIEGENDGGGR